MSQELKAFYQAILNWIELGCPCSDNFPFEQSTGLCRNLTIFIRRNWDNWQTLVNVTEEMRQQFRDAGLNEVYPFNEIEQSYYTEGDDGTKYQNPHRLIWIKQHASDHG